MAGHAKHVLRFSITCSAAAVPTVIFQQMSFYFGTPGFILFLPLWALVFFCAGILIGSLGEYLSHRRHAGYRPKGSTAVGAVTCFVIFVALSFSFAYLSSTIGCALGESTDVDCTTFAYAVDYYGLTKLLLFPVGGAVVGGFIGSKYRDYFTTVAATPLPAE